MSQINCAEAFKSSTRHPGGFWSAISGLLPMMLLCAGLSNGGVGVLHAEVRPQVQKSPARTEGKKPISASTIYHGVWSGQTSQGKPIVMVIIKGGLRGIKLGYVLGFDDPVPNKNDSRLGLVKAEGTIQSAYGDSGLTLVKDRFVSTEKDRSSGVQVVVTGQIKPDSSASGQLKFSSAGLQKPVTATWDAKRVPKDQWEANIPSNAFGWEDFLQELEAPGK